MKRSATHLFWKLLLPKIMRGCPCGRQRRCRKRIDEYENRRQVVKGGVLGFAVIIPGVSGSSMASDAARPRANPRGFSPLTQQKRRSAKPLCRFWRKVRDYLRPHENKMEMTGRRLDGFGRCASPPEPAGVSSPPPFPGIKTKKKSRGDVL